MKRNLKSSLMLGALAALLLTFTHSVTANDLIVVPFGSPVRPGYTVLQRPMIVGEAPVVVQRPVVEMSRTVPHAAYYGPVYVGPRAYSVYRPVTRYYAPFGPTVVYRPAYGTTGFYAPGAVYSPGIVIVRQKVYVQGQPIRNAIRAITP